MTSTFLVAWYTRVSFAHCMVSFTWQVEQIKLVKENLLVFYISKGVKNVPLKLPKKTYYTFLIKKAYMGVNIRGNVWTRFIYETKRLSSGKYNQICFSRHSWEMRCPFTTIQIIYQIIIHWTASREKDSGKWIIYLAFIVNSQEMTICRSDSLMQFEVGKATKEHVSPDQTRTQVRLFGRMMRSGKCLQIIRC